MKNIGKPNYSQFVSVKSGCGQEITDSDEYIDCKFRQIRKFIKSFETNTQKSHDNDEPSTSRHNPNSLNFFVRVDIKTCAIDSMNHSYPFVREYHVSSLVRSEIVKK